MPRNKRTFDEAELEVPLEPTAQPENMEMLNRLRNMWEFASLMQYIHLFGEVVKIEKDFDIEELEAACLAPQPSERLARVGLQLLKFVSSHRGLTPDIFDEYTRRQYLAKAPLRNPFGDEEEPAKFANFDVFTKIRVLHQLSTWTLVNPDRMRSAMSPETDDMDWRMEPIGWDREDRTYYVLDDDRMYRRADEPVPPPTPPSKPKAKSKSVKKPRPKGTRTSKRRKVEEASEDEAEAEAADTATAEQDDTVMTNGDDTVHEEEESGFGFTSKTWECVAITLEEYQEFMASIFRTRDPNEKILRKRIEDDVLPIIEKRAESQRLKHQRKMREIENLQKLATAKRSSRIADKAERDKQEREEREAEEKRQRELKMAHEEQERQRRIEEGHESRRLTREQRLKEREVKRILHEEELAKLEEAANRAESQDPGSDVANDASKRISERQLKTQTARHKKELEMMAEDEDNWVFDCSKCGVHGENLDDGTHSIACERCNVWQHSKCHGFSPKQAEKDGFHFVCSTCKRKEEDAKKPKIPPIKLSNKTKSPEVHLPKMSGSSPPVVNGQRPAPLPDHISRQLDGPQFHYYQPPQYTHPGPFGQVMNGPQYSPTPYAQPQRPQQQYQWSHGRPLAPQPSPIQQQPWQGSPLPPPGRPPSSGYANSPAPSMPNGYGSSNHHQQHQYAHQNAVASAGGHPGYRPPHSPLNEQNRSPGAYPMGMSPSQQTTQYYQPQTHYHGNQLPPNRHSPPQQPHNTGMPMNGAGSPVKIAAKHSASPPQRGIMSQPPPPPQPNQAHQPIQPHQSNQVWQPNQPHSSNQSRQPSQGHQPNQAYQPSHHPNQGLSRSPHTDFPPPTATYTAHGAQSPVKPSPTPNQYYQPQQQQPRPSPHAAPPQLAPSPQAIPPALSNGEPRPYQIHTPQPSHPSPANSNAKGIAADGMSGPWPESSKTIPQKSDQSPAPPPSSHAVGETRILPPVAPLAPCPSTNAQMASALPAPGGVPVKKMPEVGATVQADGAPSVAGVNASPRDVVEKAPVMNGPTLPPAVPISDVAGAAENEPAVNGIASTTASVPAASEGVQE